LPWFASIVAAAAGSSIVAAVAGSAAARAARRLPKRTRWLAGWEAGVARAAQGYKLRAQLV